MTLLNKIKNIQFMNNLQHYNVKILTLIFIFQNLLRCKLNEKNKKYTIYVQFKHQMSDFKYLFLLFKMYFCITLLKVKKINLCKIYTIEMFEPQHSFLFSKTHLFIT